MTIRLSQLDPRLHFIIHHVISFSVICLDSDYYTQKVKKKMFSIFHPYVKPEKEQKKVSQWRREPTDPNSFIDSSHFIVKSLWSSLRKSQSKLTPLLSLWINSTHLPSAPVAEDEMKKRKSPSCPLFTATSLQPWAPQPEPCSRYFNTSWGPSSVCQNVTLHFARLPARCRMISASEASRQESQNAGNRCCPNVWKKNQTNNRLKSYFTARDATSVEAGAVVTGKMLLRCFPR